MELVRGRAGRGWVRWGGRRFFFGGLLEFCCFSSEELEGNDGERMGICAIADGPGATT